MPIIVSACLLGVRCRYDGESKPCLKALELAKDGQAIAVCPEQLGGLPTPREAAELRGGRVITASGVDLTERFYRGAEESVRIAKAAGATEALLKSRSPSCGCGLVYDGTFTGTLVPGDGIAAAALKTAGLTVRTETEI